MKRKYALYLLISAFLPVFSCTHWLIDTETRIQVENKTNEEIHSLSLVSCENLCGDYILFFKDTINLVPDTIKPGYKSKIYEHELVGKFKFAIYSGDTPYFLLDQERRFEHELKGGSVLMQINGESPYFFVDFR